MNLQEILHDYSTVFPFNNRTSFYIKKIFNVRGGIAYEVEGETFKEETKAESHLKSKLVQKLLGYIDHAFSLTSDRSFMRQLQAIQDKYIGYIDRRKAAF